jgi:hypothetical protein
LEFCLKDGSSRTHLQEGILDRFLGHIILRPRADSSDESMATTPVSLICFLKRALLISHSVLYAHKVHTAWWDDINKPEQFGFASQ